MGSLVWVFGVAVDDYKDDDDDSIGAECALSAGLTCQLLLLLILLLLVMMISVERGEMRAEKLNWRHSHN